MKELPAFARRGIRLIRAIRHVIPGKRGCEEKVSTSHTKKRADPQARPLCNFKSSRLLPLANQRQAAQTQAKQCQCRRFGDSFEIELHISRARVDVNVIDQASEPGSPPGPR